MATVSQQSQACSSEGGRDKLASASPGHILKGWKGSLEVSSPISTGDRMDFDKDAHGHVWWLLTRKRSPAGNTLRFLSAPGLCSEELTSWRSCYEQSSRRKAQQQSLQRWTPWHSLQKRTGLPWRKLEGLCFSHLNPEQQLFKRWRLEPRSDTSSVRNTWILFRVGKELICKVFFDGLCPVQSWQGTWKDKFITEELPWACMET